MFLAPDDYDTAYIDVVGRAATVLTLDGELKEGSWTMIGPELGVRRIALGAGKQGAHTLAASDPIGLQVIGYGSYTSYMYPEVSTSPRSLRHL